MDHAFYVRRVYVTARIALNCELNKTTAFSWLFEESKLKIFTCSEMKCQNKKFSFCQRIFFFSLSFTFIHHWLVVTATELSLNHLNGIFFVHLNWNCRFGSCFCCWKLSLLNRIRLKMKCVQQEKRDTIQDCYLWMLPFFASLFLSCMCNFQWIRNGIRSDSINFTLWYFFRRN